MAPGSQGTHSLLIGGELRRIASAPTLKKKRPASAGSQVSRNHKASDDHILCAHDIHRITARWDQGPWAVLEERKTVVVRLQQPPGEDGIVRIPHIVGAKLEKHRDENEWVVVIETCHQCESHRQEWLRHDPKDYRSALEVVQLACKMLDGARPLQCIPLETPDLGQRIGAFEVFLLPPRICEPGYFAYLIHSKLLTRKWPSQQSLLHRLRDDMPRLDWRGWKLALHGLKSNLDIFSCWKKAQEEAKHLEEEMAELAGHAEKQVADLEQQLSELPEMQYSLEQLEHQKADLMDQLKTCRQELDSATCREKELQKQLQRTKETNFAAEAELRANLHRLEDQLKDRDTTIKDLAASQGQMLDAQQTAGSTNQTLQKDLERVRLELAECQFQIRNLEEEKRALGTEGDVSRSEISGLNEELAEMTRRNADFQRQLEEMQKDLEAKDQRLGQFDDLEIAKQQLEDQNRELMDKLQLCEQQKFMAETEQKTLNRSILSTSLREKELQKDLWLMEEMKLTSEEELKAKLTDLEDQLKEKDATIRDMASSQAHMLDVQHAAGTASQSLQREVEDLQSLLRAERQDFQFRISNLEDEKEVLSAEEKSRRAELRGLREELDAAHRSNSELKKQLEESLRVQRLQEAQHQADCSAGQVLPRCAEPQMDTAMSEPSVQPESAVPTLDAQAAVPQRIDPQEPALLIQAARSEPAPYEFAEPTLAEAEVPPQMQAAKSEPAVPREVVPPPPVQAGPPAVPSPVETGAPRAPPEPPAMLEPKEPAPTIEAVTRAEVSDEEVSTVSTETEISVDDSEDSAVMR